MPEFKPVRGMRDLLADETKRLTFIINNARETAKQYCYDEVTTPVVESHELVSAKSGDEIRARMFTFKDLGDRIVSLRPEFTASIARLATTVLKKAPRPIRVFSVGSVYRYDEPQKGRYREFWQSNFELMGSDKPEADAELILLSNNFLKRTGLRNYFFKVGHIGIVKSILSKEEVDEKTQNNVLQLMDKKEYAKAFDLLKDNPRSILEGLVEIKGNNVFEIIEKIKNQVKTYEKAKAAADNLLKILELVTRCDCPIKSIESTFSRGLEYYTGLIFEIQIPELDISLGGGGRYDRLIGLFGGISTPAVGVAHGLDRINLALKVQDIKVKDQNLKKVLVIPITKDLIIKALIISEELRNSGLFVEFEVMGRKMGKAIEYANKSTMDYVVLVGRSELQTDSVVLKDLAKHEQMTVKIENLAMKIKG
jgi:histidyl-tRNA synthetase